MTEADRPRREVGLALVGVIFFMSGFPALIYQLVWQRSLFTIYGINVESVTVIVTAFMLGLGLGSLVGGVISRRERLPLLLVFGAIEFGIALFGALSIGLFHRVGEITLHFSPLATAAVTLGLVVLPTMLMGATLPILTAYLVGRSGNVGRSVGFLYFVNTLGSSAACFVCAVVLMRVAGIQGSVTFAASINALVGIGAILLWLRTRHSAARIGSAPGEGGATEPAAMQSARIAFPAALLVAAAAGFISLSYEIVWFRTFSFASATSPIAFAAILGAYLAGIAFGSLGARRYCGPLDAEGAAHAKALAVFVLLANSVGFLMIPAIAFFASHGLGYVFWSLGLIAIHAGLLGATFPLISHYAIPPDADAGRRLSYVYFANIVGSASGSLVTGFVLLDVLEIRQITVLLTLLGLALGVVLLFGASESRQRLAASVAGVGVLAAVVVASSGVLFHDFYARLLFKGEYGTIGLTEIVENKHGVITVAEDGRVFGGGGYDGNLAPLD
ncbi:MAG: spermidine synthase, partial [Deltaproteobacteria bacterium]|nr:spermidine synthase [Deltaproteobacteria bacterium]